MAATYPKEKIDTPKLATQMCSESSKEKPRAQVSCPQSLQNLCNEDCGSFDITPLIFRIWSFGVGSPSVSGTMSEKSLAYDTVSLTVEAH